MQCVLILQENYLGEDQRFTDLSFTGDDASSVDTVHISRDPVSSGKFDKRVYRPLAVRVNAVLNDIQAHLVKVSSFCLALTNCLLFYAFYNFLYFMCLQTITM